MNKTVLISDIHFGVNKNSEIFLESSLLFFKKQLLPYMNDNNITRLFILGDVYENRTAINVHVSNEVHKLFAVDFANIEIIILIGNHDIYYKTTNEVHSLKTLNLLDNVRIVDEIETININGVDILWCPWVVDYSDTSIISEFEKSPAKLLFGHFDIVGFNLNKTRISSIGLHPEDFTKFKKVFSGHYHTPSSKRIGSTEIIYCGSPYQTNRNDLGEDKGFIVLNLDTLRYKRISNNVSIKYIEVEYPEIPDAEVVEGNIVDAIITIEKEEAQGDVIDKYLESIEKLKPLELNPSLNIIIHEHSDFDITANNINSVKDLFETYINNTDAIDNKEDILYLINDIHDSVI